MSLLIGINPSYFFVNFTESTSQIKYFDPMQSLVSAIFSAPMAYYYYYG